MFDVPQLDPPLFPPIAHEPRGPACTGDSLSKEQVRRAVHRVCRAVGLPLVCPHALRGTFASMAIRSGATMEAVAVALGQAGPGVAERHYVTGEAVAQGRVRGRMTVIDGGK